MLKKAYFLGLASLFGLPVHLVPHTRHLDWAHLAVFALGVTCAFIGLSRRP